MAKRTKKNTNIPGIRTPVLCPMCRQEMPRVTHGAKDYFQCTNSNCAHRRWHTKSGELAFPLPSDMFKKAN